jgi:molybdate transport system regulatory protein
MRSCQRPGVRRPVSVICANIAAVVTRASLGVRLRIDLGESSLGPGKIALLEQIHTSGSLSQAARELKMSYRRAWLLLDDLNHAFSEPVSTASVGGAGGGGAQLTDFGRKLIESFRELEQASRELAGRRFGWLAELTATQPRGLPRRSLARTRPAGAGARERREPPSRR